MKFLLICSLLTLATNVHALDIDKFPELCSKEAQDLQSIGGEVQEMENDALAKVFMAAMRGYIYDAKDCKGVELGANKLKAALDSLSSSN